ncbi:MAG: phosphodiester glycosidase family protein [Alphaproteobacteria bacterium]|nr:phosphodiester glycosidase family protein [Alphaproteobacteria bacterium]
MYKKIRYLGSTVHIYEFNQKTHRMEILTGVPGKLEPLSRMGRGAKVRVNCGYFGKTTEHMGLWSKDWTTVVYDDNGDQLLHFEESNERDELPSTLTFGAAFTVYEEGLPSIRNTKPFPHYAQRHPRTMIAQRPNRNILLIVVDGRRVGELGMTAMQLASLCKYLKVRCAVTFDGGGSSEMMVGEKIVNRPSDGRERAIGSCMAIYKK